MSDGIRLLPVMALLVLGCKTCTCWALKVAIGAPLLKPQAITRPYAGVAGCLRCAAGYGSDAAKKKVLVVGAGWGGLGAAWHPSKMDNVAHTMTPPEASSKSISITQESCWACQIPPSSTKCTATCAP